MQTGKSAMASAKETASNIAASAKSGMDKTKATVQEKVCHLLFLVCFLNLCDVNLSKYIMFLGSADGEDDGA